jgi:hypothetical protein
MKRRTLLAVGITTGALLALAGGTLALVTPGRRESRLTTSGRNLFSALAQAILGDTLPSQPAARQAALDAHLSRIEATKIGRASCRERV